MSESDIIKGCVKQDRASQKTLYEMYYGKMMGACMRYAKNRDDAKDMLNEGFMKVFTNIKSYSNTGSFEGWIRRIIVNNAIDHLRKNKHEYLIVNTVHANTLSSTIQDEAAEDDMLNHISQEDILAAVQALSPAYRTVFNLYVIEDLSHKEIAERLDISEGTSKSNLAKAKFNLRKNLIQQIPSLNAKA